MGIKILNYILAAAGLAGHVLLATMLVRRRLVLRLPLFTALIAFYLLRSTILLLANFIGISAWTYWIMIGFDPVLQFLLFLTIAVAAALRSSIAAKTLRPSAAVGLVIIAIGTAGLVAWYIGPSSHFSPANLSIKAGVFVSVLWIEAGIAMAASSADPLRQMPPLTRRLVGGFAIYSAANVVTEIGRMHVASLRPTWLYLALSYTRVSAYSACLALWILACSREPRTPSAGRADSSGVGPSDRPAKRIA